MRLFLKLKHINGILKFNYNYYISSAIYNQLKGTKFEKIHNNKISEFTFYLDINKSKLNNYSDKELTLIISSSNSDLLNFLKTKLINNILLIDKAIFKIDDIIAIEYNNFEGSSFLLETITPINLSCKRKDGGEDYLHPLNNSNYIELMKKNILRKANNPNYNEKEIEILIPEQDIKSKLIDIKGIKVKGYNYKFLINAPKELIKNSIYNGFGLKNAQGFGFVNILNSK